MMGGVSVSQPLAPPVLRKHSYPNLQNGDKMQDLSLSETSEPLKFTVSSVIKKAAIFVAKSVAYVAVGTYVLGFMHGFYDGLMGI